MKHIFWQASDNSITTNMFFVWSCFVEENYSERLSEVYHFSWQVELVECLRNNNNLFPGHAAAAGSFRRQSLRCRGWARMWECLGSGTECWMLPLITPTGNLDNSDDEKHLWHSHWTLIKQWMVHIPQCHSCALLHQLNVNSLLRYFLL